MKKVISVGLLGYLSNGYGSYNSGSYQSSSIKGKQSGYGSNIKGSGYGDRFYNTGGQSNFIGGELDLSEALRDASAVYGRDPVERNGLKKEGNYNKGYNVPETPKYSDWNNDYNNNKKQTDYNPKQPDWNKGYNNNNKGYNNNNIGYNNNKGYNNNDKGYNPEPKKNEHGHDYVYGRPGADGAPGKNGRHGAPGPVGHPGPPGKPGPKGDQGPKGKPGRDGINGKNGERGPPGKPGKSKDGKRGPKGDRGKPGIPGKDGIDGANGKPGANGKAGPRGYPGNPGKDGLQGKPGLKGEPGVQGRDGPRGPQGKPGKPAYNGPPGKPGPPGPPGKCDCSKFKKRPRKGGVNPVHIDTGIYDSDLTGGGYYSMYEGAGKGLSGNGGYDNGYGNAYLPKGAGAKLPEKYSDGYDPKKYANYNVNLPKAASVTNGYGNHGVNNLNKKVARASVGGGVGHGVGKGKNIHHGKGKGHAKGENKEFVKANNNANKANVYVDADLRQRANGYDDQLAYAGAEVYEDAAAKQSGYVKGEAYDKLGQDVTRKEALYGGDAVYQTDDVKTNAKVAFEVNHALKFKNNYNDENHRGSYKGDEFEVGYKASDVQGGYKNNEIDREKKSAAYKGEKAVGDFAKTGKYYGDDYHKYGDEDTNMYYRDRGVGHTPEGFDPKYGGSPDKKFDDGSKPDLYAKFKGGDGKLGDGVPNYGKGKGKDGAILYPYGERYRVNTNEDKDANYRGHGANFEGKDTFAKNNEKEVYAGAQEKINEKIAFDKGNYRDVNAKGKNKFATYAGDYQTNKKDQDVVFNVKHYEDLTQDLQQDIKSDQYYAKYEGEDIKKAKDAERKYGHYNDAEHVRKKDALINGKAYKGDEYANLDNRRANAGVHTKIGVDSVKGTHLHAKPKGYRGEDKKRYGNDLHDDKRRSNLPYRGTPDNGVSGERYENNGIRDRVRNGDYDYYSPRRLITQDINDLKTQIASLKITEIMTNVDIIYGIIGLVLSAIFGALSFIAIMNLCGYKATKIVKQNNNAQQLLSESE